MELLWYNIIKSIYVTKLFFNGEKEKDNVEGQ
jgi:hypothetical protein